MTNGRVAVFGTGAQCRSGEFDNGMLGKSQATSEEMQREVGQVRSMRMVMADAAAHAENGGRFEEIRGGGKDQTGGVRTKGTKEQDVRGESQERR